MTCAAHQALDQGHDLVGRGAARGRLGGRVTWVPRPEVIDASRRPARRARPRGRAVWADWEVADSPDDRLMHTTASAPASAWRRNAASSAPVPGPRSRAGRPTSELLVELLDGEVGAVGVLLVAEADRQRHDLDPQPVDSSALRSADESVTMRTGMAGDPTSVRAPRPDGRRATRCGCAAGPCGPDGAGVVPAGAGGGGPRRRGGGPDRGARCVGWDTLAGAVAARPAAGPAAPASPVPAGAAAPRPRPRPVPGGTAGTDRPGRHQGGATGGSAPVPGPPDGEEQAGAHRQHRGPPPRWRSGRTSNVVESRTRVPSGLVTVTSRLSTPEVRAHRHLDAGGAGRQHLVEAVAVRELRAGRRPAGPHAQVVVGQVRERDGDGARAGREGDPELVEPDDRASSPAAEHPVDVGVAERRSSGSRCRCSSSEWSSDAPHLDVVERRAHPGGAAGRCRASAAIEPSRSSTSWAPARSSQVRRIIGGGTSRGRCARRGTTSAACPSASARGRRRRRRCRAGRLAAGVDEDRPRVRGPLRTR